MIRKIVKATGVSSDWLLTGEGPMYRAEGNAVAEPLAARASTPDLVQVPEYDLQLAAGHGSYPADHALAINSRAFSRKWLINKGLQTDKLALARVHGESMEPLLKDKDLVLIDRARTIPSDAMPYAVRWEDALYIKMAQRGQQVLRLLSLNKLYSPIEIDLAADNHNCEIIGGVVWHAHSWV